MQIRGGPWKGTLLTDGYSGYDEVTRRNQLHCAECWSHARRKFKEALDTGPRDAAIMLRTIQRLFRLEAAMRKRCQAREYSKDASRELRIATARKNKLPF